MTYGITSTIAQNATIQFPNNKNGQVALKQGDVINGSIVDTRDTSISVAVEEGSSQQIINLQLGKELDFKMNDQVEIEVLKRSKDILEISIRKIEESDEEMANNHDPLSDSVNLDEVKKTILASDNSLQYSKQLDNHIEHAIAQVDDMLGSFSDEKINTILKENFDATKMTIALLYQVANSREVDKKISLLGDDRVVDISVNEEKIDRLIEQISSKNILNTSAKSDIAAIVKGLVNTDIKPELKNVEKLANFVEKVDKVKQMKGKDIIQFLSSNKESSIGELYKSLYISNNVKKDVISENDYKAIEADVSKIIEDNFKEFDQEIVDDVKDTAKSLVKKGIPIDSRAIETIKYVKEAFNLDESITLATNQIKKQEKLDNINVTSGLNQQTILNKEDIESFVNLVNKVSDEDVKALVLKNQSVSFHELELQMEEVIEKANGVEIGLKTSASPGQYAMNQSSVNEIPVEVQQTIDKNVENLQVIRYQMTYKAAMSLSIQGVDLKNTNLDVMRERIESFERLHIEPTKEMPVKIQGENVNSLEAKVDSQTSQSLSKKELAVLEVRKHMAIISGSSTRSIATIALEQTGKSETVSDVNIDRLEESTSVVSILSLAKAAATGADRYDELRTMPRKDLGDHIEKAFANVGDILKDLNLENTTYNQRAVEILGRNEMPISLSNIEAVKELDIELQELFSKLMPEHIKDLVEQNIDIVNEPIENLVDYVRGQNSGVEKDMEEQVAKHIMTMLKNNDITTEQKDALVGVYRMIHTIDASKGAAVGFLVNNDLEVNMENLFDAAKAINKSQYSDSIIDASVDDSFGEFESVSKDVMTIKQQIQSGYFEKESSLNNLVDKVLFDSESQVNLGEINAESQVSQDEARNMTSGIEEALKLINSSIQKEEVSEFKDLLSTVQKMQNGELKESFRQNNDPSLNDLKAFDELSKNPAVMKDLLKEFDALSAEFEPLSGKIQSKLAEFTDNLTPGGQEVFGKAMKEVFEEAKDYAMKDFFDQQELDPSQSTIKDNVAFSGDKSIHELSKDIESQLSLQKQLIDNEDYYSVPVMINGEMQHMSMYYFRQEAEVQKQDDDMSVYLSFTTENIGTANIRVQLSGEASNVTIYATSDTGNRQLKNHENEIKEMFNEVGLSVDKMKYDTFILPTPVKPDQKITTANKVSKYNQNLFEKTI